MTRGYGVVETARKPRTAMTCSLLEFIGDRVVNLPCALMVEVKYSSHQMWVGRVISNNDTLGRLAYQLQLHEQARLDLHDLFQV
ncbi:hypothetical protein L208DRAFT_1463488 [Tricholoma matsutake]|nr:hypothetical protein L208DRAFT_1463488 [Tricholoma matsutake 945]